MITIPIIFKFHDKDVRVITDNENTPWFNANDVCSALTLKNPRQALVSHLNGMYTLNFMTPSGGGPQLTRYISKAGIYCLIIGSRKPGTSEFKDWLTSEVLPAIKQRVI